jgi:hypothetical protein
VCGAAGHRHVGGRDGDGHCAAKRLGKSASLQARQVPQILRALEDAKELPSMVQALHLTASQEAALVGGLVIFRIGYRALSPRILLTLRVERVGPL